MKRLFLAIALFMPSVLVAGSVIQLKSISDQSLKSIDDVKFKKVEVNGNIFSNSSSIGSVLMGQVSNYPGIWFGSNTAAPTTSNYALLFDNNAGKGITFNSPSTYSVSYRINNIDYMRLSTSGGLALGSVYYSTDPGVGNMIIQGKVSIGKTTSAEKLQISTSTTSGYSLGFAGAFQTLPTSGHEEGTMAYQVSDHTLYISTKTITATGDWKSVW